MGNILEETIKRHWPWKSSGDYKNAVKYIIERRERLALRQKVGIEDHLQIY